MDDALAERLARIDALTLEHRHLWQQAVWRGCLAEAMLHERAWDRLLGLRVRVQNEAARPPL